MRLLDQAEVIQDLYGLDLAEGWHARLEEHMFEDTDSEMLYQDGMDGFDCDVELNTPMGPRPDGTQGLVQALQQLLRSGLRGGLDPEILIALSPGDRLAVRLYGSESASCIASLTQEKFPACISVTIQAWGRLMMVSAMVAIVIAALLAGGLWVIVHRAVGASAHRPPEGGVTSTASRADIALVYQSEARASQAALAAGCGVAVLMWAWDTWWTQGFGLPISLAGSVGAVVGMVAYAVIPRKLWTSDPSAGAVADLTPRRPTSFARQWVFVFPTVAAIILALGLLLTGLYSATDENGLHRVFQRRNLAGWGVENGQVIDIQYNLTSTGPFPGWYYGVPVMICTALMILAVYWSLNRTAAAPRPPSAELFHADTVLREMRTTFIMAASSAALTFQIAGLAAITGNVLRFAHYDAVPTADLMAPAGFTPVEPGHTLALTLLLSALPLAVVAVALLAKAIAVSMDMGSLAQSTRRTPQEPAR